MEEKSWSGCELAPTIRDRRVVIKIGDYQKEILGSLTLLLLK
jgi:hypothetical protein